MLNRFIFIYLLTHLNPCLAISSVYWGGGVAGSIPTVNFPIKSEPPNINGYRLSFQIYHSALNWEKVSLFLDGSYANYMAYSTFLSSHKNISILALAPVLRYQFYHSSIINPFIDLSIGPSYMSKTKFIRNLGIHYSFQDTVGLGLKLGKNNNMSISWKIIHYSNGGLSEHNGGVTVPIVIVFNYIFNTPSS